MKKGVGKPDRRERVLSPTRSSAQAFSSFPAASATARSGRRWASETNDNHPSRVYPCAGALPPEGSTFARRSLRLRSNVGLRSPISPTYLPYLFTTQEKN